MTGLTEALAEFIHAKTLQDLPPEALDKAKKAIADTFAVILAGAGSEVAPPLLRYVEQTGDSGTSPILGHGRTVSPEMAALVNGTFGHALDFDDVLSMMPAHPSAVILPALIADLRAGNFPAGRSSRPMSSVSRSAARSAWRSRSATTTGASTAPARWPSSPRWRRWPNATISTWRRRGRRLASPPRWPAACSATSAP